MILFPAIDILDGKVVRLFKGNYNEITQYNDHPYKVGIDFAKQGAEAVHIVDLDGAKDGTTVNFEAVKRIKDESGLFCEIGGGIRDLSLVEKYLSAGLDRVILGTAAVQNPAFLKAALKAFGDQIAVGVDLKDGFVAIQGWTEQSQWAAMDFCEEMQDLGVRTLIVTDISKDGAMKGTNHDLYRDLSDRFKMNITASGGVSSLEDVRRLSALNLYGAIIGKAYYTGDILLPEALAIASKETVL